MRHSRAVHSQYFNILLSGSDRMSNERPRIQYAGFLQNAYWSDPPRFHRGFGLAFRFRRVNMNADLQLFCAGGGRPEKNIVAGVRRMRGHPCCDSSFSRSVPFCDELRGAVNDGRTLAAKHGPAQRSAGAGGFHGLGGLIHEEIVVGHGGHAGLDHLGEAEKHAPVDILLLQVALQRPHVFVEPLVERHILGEPPENHHRHMRMTVDQPRHHQPAAGINDLLCNIPVHCPGRFHGGNAVALNQHIVILQHIHLSARQMLQNGSSADQNGHCGFVFLHGDGSRALSSIFFMSRTAG